MIFPVIQWSETRARFLLPTRFGDEVAIETAVVACGRSSFKLEHRLTRGGALAAEGFETRVWVARRSHRPNANKIAAHSAASRRAADAWQPCSVALSDGAGTRCYKPSRKNGERIAHADAC